MLAILSRLLDKGGTTGGIFMQSHRALGVTLASALALGACASAPPVIGSGYRAQPDQAVVLMMDPDVSVTLRTVAGAERRADWSETAKQNLTTSFRAAFGRSGEKVLFLSPERAKAEEIQQALLLSQAVTQSIAAHKMLVDPSVYAGPLPHQAKSPEVYTLGEDVKQLVTDTNVDYVAFLQSRTTIEGADLILTKVLLAAVTGVVVVGGQFAGTYLTVVDVKTGEVVWVRGVNFGDLRNPGEADAAAAEIFKDSPFAPASAVQTKARGRK
jgi:hypothetical protein